MKENQLVSIGLKPEERVLPMKKLAELAEQRPNQVYLRQPRNREIREYTWSETYDMVLRLAAGFKQLGLQSGDKVVIYSENCADWFLTDFAIMAAGLISVPIYATAEKKTISYILEHSQAKAIVVGKLQDKSGVEQAVTDDLITISMSFDTMDCQYSLEELIKNNDPVDSVPEPDQEEVFSISYTSGSTGVPKGVVLTYKNIMFGATRMVNAPDRPERESTISYLPLAHITERALVEYGSLYGGAQVSFIESIGTFIEDLKGAKVTSFLSVPRLWMRFRAGVLEKTSQKTLNTLLRIPILSGLVKKKIKQQLGFEYATSFGSGSAPIAPSVLEWYRSVGINISEGWGMTEVTGAGISHYPFRKDKIGTIGVPVDGVEFKVSDNEELLIRGDCVFKEYYKNEEATRGAFTDDGWMRTGDCAKVDKDGFVTITGRVKELFKSGKGKYVAPVPIEGLLGVNRLVEQICVMGAGLPQPVAIMVLSKETSQGLEKQEIIASLGSTLESVNTQLEKHERLNGIMIVGDEWTVENGFLTHTLKIKRDLLEKKYSDSLDRDWSESVVWR